MFRVPELRQRILFTLGMLAIFRLGAHIPVPGINPAPLTRALKQMAFTVEPGKIQLALELE
jgi:preprotein translocase subunit SecY